ncbi:MAG: phosphonate ABC transporter, permease protein PhnE [Burkholderiales bacterium]|nr:phosphonate ABC transporter, permease protein PhnE [Burkholderiales bacterium]
MSAADGTSVAANPLAARVWQRFTPAERLARFSIYFAIVFAVAWAAHSVEVIVEFIWDAPAQVADMGSRMWPIAWGHYARGVHGALIETLNIAAVSTLLGVLMAVPVGFLAARNATRNRFLNTLARFILVATRSINTLLWALFFVAVFGPGALAGTLAIAFHSIGFIGKLFSEAVEDVHKGGVEALTAAGASRLALIQYAYWPQVKPTFWAIALFRWDINVRESAVLGLVGAGGLGMALDTAINLFQWDRVALILVTIFAVVIVAEFVVTEIRKRII